MKTIVTIVGARTQFIKVAPVSRAIHATGKAREILVHTGQHFDVSDLLFTSTDAAAVNLANEGIDLANFHTVGDVMYDAALLFATKKKAHSGLLAELGVEPGKYVLPTLHRAENTDDPVVLANLVAALERVAAQVPVVLPPRTRNAMARLGLAFDKVKVIEPVGNLAMVALESQAAAIATDSGGVQKEAFFYQVPCITMRTETEWSELLDLGWNRPADPAGPSIADEILASIGRTGQAAHPYGDGTASQSIAAALVA